MGKEMLTRRSFHERKSRTWKRGTYYDYYFVWIIINERGTIKCTEIYKEKKLKICISMKCEFDDSSNVCVCNVFFHLFLIMEKNINFFR